MDDGRWGQPLRPGGNLDDWIIGDSQRKFDEHIRRTNQPTAPDPIWTPAPPSFPAPTPPAPTWTAPQTGSSGSASGPGFEPLPREPVSAADMREAVLGLGMLFVGPVFWPIFYPMPVLAALAAALGSGLLVYHFVVAGSAFALLYFIPLVVALVVLVGASRLDHRLGRSLIYSIPRHLIRLALLGIVVWHFAGASRLRYPAGVPIVDVLRRSATDPIRLGVTAVAILAFHVLLVHFPSLRTTWHEGLEGIGLRPK
jgi:hypothetical protein